MSAYTVTSMPVKTDFGVVEPETAGDAPSANVFHFDEPERVGTGMVLRSQLMDAATAFKLGVAGVGDADVKAKKSVLVYELSVRYGEETRQISPGEWKRFRLVLGVQLAFIFTVHEPNLRVNLTSLSLASQAKLATTKFELGLNGLANASEISGVGDLTQEDESNKVIVYLEDTLKTLADTTKPLPPVPVPINEEITGETDEDQAMLFALRGIEKRLTLEQLLENNLSKGHDQRHIVAIYQHITESLEPTAEVTPVHAGRAHDYLEWKRVD